MTATVVHDVETAGAGGSQTAAVGAAAGDDRATLGSENPQPPQPPLPPSLQPWEDRQRLVGWMVTALVGIVAAVCRFWALGFPSTKNFDEVYYATEAQELLRFGYEDNRGYMFIVHPPLGKWLIGFTSLIWGNSSFGWRVAPAVAGTIGVIIVVRLARRMFRSTLFGAIAGTLFALDGLSFVLARTALLDIFLQTFLIAGFAALVIDRDKMRARLAGLLTAGIDLNAGVPSFGPRPWRLLAGVLLGLACCVKWTALSFYVVFAILSLVWDRGALRAAGVRRPTRPTFRRCVLPAIGSLVLAPVVAYLVPYVGWFTGENGWYRHWADTASTHTHLHVLGVHIPFWWGWVPAPLRALGANILDAYRFHEGLDSGHTYQSNPWTWLVDGRPVDFYYNGSSTTCGASTCSREILDLGTPLLWWAFIPMLVWLAWHWFTTRDWRASAIWVAFAAGWLVWFQDLKRTMFFFYMAPLVPFLVLGLTLALGTMWGRAPIYTGDDSIDAPRYRRQLCGIAGVSAYLGLVIADFVWMWPIFTGGLLTYNEWHMRMWLPSWI